MRRFSLIGGIVAIVVLLLVGAVIGIKVEHALAPSPSAETTANFRDWRLSCPAPSVAGGHCVLTQDVILDTNKATLVRLSVEHAGSMPSLTITVPHHVAIPAGIAVVIGQAPARALPFETCDEVGCIALLPMDGATENLMVSSKGGTVSFRTADAKPVTLPFTLSGYKDGEDALRVDRLRHFSWLSPILR